MIKCKKVISLAMLLVMMATMFSTNVYAALPPLSILLKNISYHDYDISDYSFNEETGELVFSGGEYVTIDGWKEKYKNEIKSVKIEEGINQIDKSAFSYCTSLKEVTIPDSVTKIDAYTFEGCTSLTSVTIPNSVYAIGNNAFKGCKSLKEITIPEKVTEIDKSAFENCTSLKEVTITEKVTEIYESAFSGCTNLTSVTIPNSVEKIGGYAFSECESLTEITIPESVTEINEYAFAECTNLKSVTYLGKTDPFVDSSEEESSDKGMTWDDSVFWECPELKEVKVPIDYKGDTFCGMKVVKGDI